MGPPAEPAPDTAEPAADTAEPATDSSDPARAGAALGTVPSGLRRLRAAWTRPWPGLAAAVILGGLAVAAKAPLDTLAGGDVGYVPFFAVIAVAAWYGGLLAGVVAVIVTAFLNAYLYLPPQGSIEISFIEQIRLVVYLGAGVLIGLLMRSLRDQRDRLQQALAEQARLGVAVRERDERLEIVLSASRTGIWEWDVATGALHWSDEVFAQHGLPSGSAPDFDAYLGLIHPDDVEAFRSVVGGAVEEGTPFTIELRVVRPDRSVRWTHVAGRAFLDAAGRPIRVLGTSEDITDRKRLEAERDALQEQDRQASEFREAFIEVLSHELRTPMTTIYGSAEVLTRARTALDPAARLDLLRDIREESERLHLLIEDLLVLSRAERGRIEAASEPVELRRVLRRVVETEAARWPSVRFDLRLADDLPVVAGEDVYIEQVTRNLLSNAAKYGPPDGLVIVEAEPADDGVSIRVLDEGPGFGNADPERLFGLFYRAETAARRVSGSGIGLFVCSRLVAAMGGRIWARAREGGGSEFGFAVRPFDEESGGDDGAIVGSGRGSVA